MRIIINADDCGYSEAVNKRIEEEILCGRISSTTVMANMNDFDGAVCLYDKYKSQISFGIHLNLTEGLALLPNQRLVDVGLYDTTNATGGGNLLNANKFRYKYLSKKIQEELYKELDAQIKKVLDAGIILSHIDSHQHIHNGTYILPVVVALAKKYDIRHIRNIRNFMPLSVGRLGRMAWTMYMKALYRGVSTTDYFTSYSEFISMQKIMKVPANSSIELMCHPGGKFPDEEQLMRVHDVTKDKEQDIINYRQLS